MTRVVTPGTVTEDDLLDPRQQSSGRDLCSAVATRRVGLAWVELSTGQFLAADVARRSAARRAGPAGAGGMPAAPKRTPMPLGDAACSRLADVPALTPRPDWTFDPRDRAGRARASTSASRRFAGFGFDDQQACLAAAGALLLYVQEMLKAEPRHICAGCSRTSAGKVLAARRSDAPQPGTDAHAARGRAAGLAAGRPRPHRHDDGRPAAAGLAARAAGRSAGDRGPARRRRRVAASSTALRDDLRERSAEVHDLQRLTARVSTGRASPRDLGADRAARCGCCRASRPRSRPGEPPLLRELEAQPRAVPRPARAARRRPGGRPAAQPRKEGGLIRPGYQRRARRAARHRPRRQGMDRPLPGRRRSPAPASPRSRSASTRSSATTSRSRTPTPPRSPPTTSASRRSRTPSATSRRS